MKMQTKRLQKQQNKQKIKFIKIQKNPNIAVWMSGFFCYTTATEPVNEKFRGMFFKISQEYYEDMG